MTDARRPTVVRRAPIPCFEACASEQDSGAEGTSALRVNTHRREVVTLPWREPGARALPDGRN